MSKNGHKEKLTDAQRNAAQWQRDKAMRAWNAGKWDLYAYHIRKADSITRRG